MKVNGFRIRNFMGFEDSGWIELPSIALLFGRNSSGKSALLHALLLLRQSLGAPPNQSPLLLNSEQGVDLGTYETIVHKHEVDRIMSFGFRCGFNETDPLEYFYPGDTTIVQGCVDWELSFNLNKATGRLQLCNMLVGFTSADNSRDRPLGGLILEAWHHADAWDFASDILTEYKQEAGYNVWPYVEVVTDPKGGFFPYLAIKQAVGGQGKQLSDPGRQVVVQRIVDHRPESTVFSAVNRWGDDFENIKSLLSLLDACVESFLLNLQYFGPVRHAPQRFYHAPSATSDFATERSLSSFRRHISNWIAGDVDPHVNQVNRWLAELDFDAVLEIQPLGRLDKFGRRFLQSVVNDRRQEITQEELARYARDNADTSLFELVLKGQAEFEVNLRDVGYGVSQALPLLLEGVVAKPGSLLVVEQPELHLHPRAQARLADILIEIAARGVRCLIETHSEHLILQLRRRIARTTLNKTRQGLGGQVLDDDENPAKLTVESKQIIGYFVERDRETGVSQVEPIEIDQYGQYTRQPDGFKTFFADDYQQAMAITKDVIAIQALEGKSTPAIGTKANP